MNCPSIDLKGYLLGELADSDRRQVDEHLVACDGCREELERFRVTQTALLSVRDEEIPRRIAFVSDKVFEPRWWQRLWHSGPRLGFASASMLSAAILVHAFVQPGVKVDPPRVDPAVIQAMVDEEVSRRVTAAVARVEAANDELREEERARMIAAVERLEDGWQADLIHAEKAFESLYKRSNVVHMARARWEVEQ